MKDDQKIKEESKAALRNALDSARSISSPRLRAAALAQIADRARELGLADIEDSAQKLEAEAIKESNLSEEQQNAIAQAKQIADAEEEKKQLRAKAIDKECEIYNGIINAIYNDISEDTKKSLLESHHNFIEEILDESQEIKQHIKDFTQSVNTLSFEKKAEKDIANISKFFDDISNNSVIDAAKKKQEAEQKAEKEKLHKIQESHPEIATIKDERDAKVAKIINGRTKQELSSEELEQISKIRKDAQNRIDEITKPEREAHYAAKANAKNNEAPKEKDIREAAEGIAFFSVMEEIKAAITDPGNLDRLKKVIFHDKKEEPEKTASAIEENLSLNRDNYIEATGVIIPNSPMGSKFNIEVGGKEFQIEVGNKVNNETLLYKIENGKREKMDSTQLVDYVEQSMNQEIITSRTNLANNIAIEDVKSVEAQRSISHNSREHQKPKSFVEMLNERSKNGNTKDDRSR